VVSLILFSIGNRRSSQQTQSNCSTFDSVTVLAIVEQSDTITELGNIAEPMSDGFKLCTIPGRVAVSWSLSETELILEDTE